MNIQLSKQSKYVIDSIIKFPGGELHPKISFNPSGAFISNIVDIIFSPKNSDDIMTLLLVVNACRKLDAECRVKCTYTLHIKYLPYARQDRVALQGEAFGLKVMADLINSLNLDSVVLYDPHSLVAPALFNNSIVEEQHVLLVPLIFSGIYKAQEEGKTVMFLAPDAGAKKKTDILASLFEAEAVSATKVRDPDTGKLSKTHIYQEDLDILCKADEIYIADDICDGGGTFILLAKHLREKGITANLHLAVTNGIFSKGKEVLTTYFKRVTTYNDWTVL